MSESSTKPAGEPSPMDLSDTPSEQAFGRYPLVMPRATVVLTRTSRGGGIDRVLTKLKASVAAGNFYEAHQMYRTLYFRYLNQRRFDDCLQMLHTGALQFLDQEQHSIGADLSCLVVDTLSKRGQPAAAAAADVELWLNRLGELLKLIGPSVVEREAFLTKSVKWSSVVSQHKLGHPLIHKIFARTLWDEANYEHAHHHYLLSRDGTGCGQMLIELSQTKGFANELDMFIAQVVLQQLSLKERETAVQTFQTYTVQHPRIGHAQPPFELPMLNFVYFLLECCETGAVETFRALCAVYKPTLERDSSFDLYLTRIGVAYFGVRASGSGGGLIGDLITRLFAGLEDGEEVTDNGADGVSATAAAAVDVDLD